MYLTTICLGLFLFSILFLNMTLKGLWFICFLLFNSAVVLFFKLLNKKVYFASIFWVVYVGAFLVLIIYTISIYPSQRFLIKSKIHYFIFFLIYWPCCYIYTLFLKGFYRYKLYLLSFKNSLSFCVVVILILITMWIVMKISLLDVFQRFRNCL